MATQGARKIVVRLGVIWLEAKGLPIGSDRFGVQPLGGQGVAEAVGGIGHLRIELLALPKSRNRAVIIVQVVAEKAAEVQVKPRKVDIRVTHFGLAWAPFWLPVGRR